MKETILIVLGSPNSSKGELSEISLSRLDHCKKLYSGTEKILCTGGWGPQFNTSEHPHASYAQAYLKEQKIPEEVFLPMALSRHTVDDAVKIKEIISGMEDIQLTIITSDYHVDRVRLIFQEILADYSLSFVGATADLSPEQRKQLAEHEQKAIQAIQKNGLYY